MADASRPSLRFGFGANWKKYLGVVNEDRITASQKSLKDMLAVETLEGLRFLDIGSGSGLFSLAARRLRASTVHSFDFDADSVGCAQHIKDRFQPGDDSWTVERGSVLDANYVRALGLFDVVYSWGVLHHTGDMRQALENAVLPVAPGGKLFISIYNDQGWISRYWLVVKRLYNTHFVLRWMMIALHAPYLIGARFLVRLFTGRLREKRGMNLWYDMLDWLGGYPFEVASPNTIRAFFTDRGFTFVRGTTCGNRHGCNEFVFLRD